MAGVRLTKNELKKQKDSLKRFRRYLPTLQLKKQQLQLVIMKVEQEKQELEGIQAKARKELESWVHVFGENETFAKGSRVKDLVTIRQVEYEKGNIAGVNIPIYQGIQFEEVPYDFLSYPLWVDRGIEALKQLAELDAQISTLEKQIRLLQRELRTTSQRVNLFEKVKIPEAAHAIRMIQIYLGDQQTAAVVRGKIAKNKIVKVS